MQQNKEAEIRFFDQFGEQGDYDVFPESGYQRILRELANLAKPQPGEVLGDFGCGTGAVTWRIQKEFALKVCGIDLSQEMIKYNQQKYPEISFSALDIEQTGLPSESFDIIVFSGVLHHFPDFSKVAREAHRLLKPGGRVFAFDPNEKNPFMWLYRSESSPISSKVGRTDNERLLGKSEICRVFADAEFQKVYVKAISGVPFRYIESAAARLLLPSYNLVDKVIDLSGLGKYIGSFLITCANKG